MRAREGGRACEGMRVRRLGKDMMEVHTGTCVYVYTYSFCAVVLQCVAMQCVAVCCSALQCVRYMCICIYIVVFI